MGEVPGSSIDYPTFHTVAAAVKAQRSDGQSGWVSGDRLEGLFAPHVKRLVTGGIWT
jgi:hypothetical protein